jgi:hypothetical protein
VTVGGAGYTYVRGLSEQKVQQPQTLQSESHSNSKMEPSARIAVQAMGKDTASILINFEYKLRQLQTKNIPYSSINRYLRASLKDEDIGMFNLRDSMTFARGEPEKTYADAYLALSQIPSTISMIGLYSIVDGLPE